MELMRLGVYGNTHEENPSGSTRHRSEWCLSETSEEAVRKVQDLLEIAMYERGRGTITRIQDFLGLGKDYFARQRRRNRLDVGILLSALEHLDIDPFDFFTEAWE